MTENKVDSDKKENSVTDSDPVKGAVLIENSLKSPVTAVTEKKGNGVARLALLLAVLVALVVACLGWILLQQQDQLQVLSGNSTNDQEQLQNYQRTVASNHSYLSDELAARGRELSSLRVALEDASVVIDGHSRRLLSLTATTTDDWRLAEVEYLLRLANQRILLSKDGVTALNLLRASDQILLELGDPRLFNVRKAIADDRAALAIVGQQDLEGVFLQLSALSGQIDKLPLLVLPKFTSAKNLALSNSSPSDSLEPEVAASLSWQQRLTAIGLSTWHELKSMVIVQRRGEEIKPLLPPEQQYYLRGNLRLLLSQAQLALLDGRQQIYSDSLTNAVDWIADYFPADESAVQMMTENLEQLSAVQVVLQLPDLSHSLLAIKAFIADQHRLNQGDVSMGQLDKERKQKAASAATNSVDLSSDKNIAISKSSLIAEQANKAEAEL